MSKELVKYMTYAYGNLEKYQEDYMGLFFEDYIDLRVEEELEHLKNSDNPLAEKLSRELVLADKEIAKLEKDINIIEKDRELLVKENKEVQKLLKKANSELMTKIAEKDKQINLLENRLNKKKKVQNLSNLDFFD